MFHPPELALPSLAEADGRGLERLLRPRLPFLIVELATAIRSCTTLGHPASARSRWWNSRFNW